jgi:hypothetical protein
MRIGKWKNALTAEEQQLCDERICQAYADLHRWIRWLASTQQIKDNWYMSADDICGEAYFILIKVARVYLHKPYPEFKILVKASIRNYCGSMRYRIALTHRKVELQSLSLDSSYDETDSELGDTISTAYDAFSDNLCTMGINPEHYAEAAENLLEIADKLNSLDLAVLDAILGFDERVGTQVRLSAARKSFVYAKKGNSTITITPLIVARALNESLEAVEESFARLKGMF